MSCLRRHATFWTSSGRSDPGKTFTCAHTLILKCVWKPCVCVSVSELEVSLLVLPFSYVPELLKLFNSYIQQGLEVELVCRCLFFLLR